MTRGKDDISLKEYIATHTDVSYEKAVDFLLSIKTKEEVKKNKENKDSTILSALMGLTGSSVTLAELAEMRAFMKMVEAECIMNMCHPDGPKVLFIKELMEEVKESEGDKGRWESILNE
jgi:hypothetical protein